MHLSGHASSTSKPHFVDYSNGHNVLRENTHRTVKEIDGIPSYLRVCLLSHLVGDDGRYNRIYHAGTRYHGTGTGSINFLGRAIHV